MADYTSEFENMLSFGPTPAAKPEAAPPLKPLTSSEQSTEAQSGSDMPAQESVPNTPVKQAEPVDGGSDNSAVHSDDTAPDSGVSSPVPEQSSGTFVLPQDEPDSADGDLDTGPGGGFAVKPRLAGDLKDMSRMSRVELPKPMVAAIRGAFPGAENRNEAVAAYIYTMMGREGPVSDRIKSLSAQYPEDDRVIDLQAKIKSLSEDLKAANDFTARRLRTLETSLDQVLTLLVWIVGERTGCKMDLSATADRLDFLYPEHETIRARVARQSSEYAEQTAHRDGLEAARRADRARDARVKAGKPRYKP